MVDPGEGRGYASGAGVNRCWSLNSSIDPGLVTFITTGLFRVKYRTLRPLRFLDLDDPDVNQSLIYGLPGDRNKFTCVREEVLKEGALRPGSPLT